MATGFFHGRSDPLSPTRDVFSYLQRIDMATDNAGGPHSSRPPGGKLSDYRTHYTIDAQAIVDPAQLPVDRQASEERRIQALLRLLDSRSGERVLDIGCGSGWLASRCAASGALVLSMDISLDGVRAARRRFPAATHLVGDVYALPVRAGSLDAVILSEVVEHLEDIAAAFAQVRSLLRPGGRVLVSVPFQERIIQHLCIHCNRFTPANAHLHSFHPGDLERQLEASGLRPRRSMLLTNKVLDRLSFARHTRWWPYWMWRGVDRLCNALSRRAGFLCVLATRPS